MQQQFEDPSGIFNSLLPQRNVSLPQFFKIQFQDGNTGFHDDNLPVTQDQVKVDQQLQHKTRL